MQKRTSMKNQRRIRLAAGALALILASSAMIGSIGAAEAGDAFVKEHTSASAAASSPFARAKRINLLINGKRVLSGRVYNLQGTTYVPMFAFADWLGNFRYTYNRSTLTATINGEKLEITATEGKLYIIVNQRYFYTEKPILANNGEIYVPISAMAKATNSRLAWSEQEQAFHVSSGDTRRIKWAEDHYKQDEVYWLAKIISAEAKGESLKGKIAVGNVILNRVRSKQFPNTIYGVIFDQKYGVQFSPVANGAIYSTPTADSIIAAKICLEGYSLSKDVLYFLNPAIAASTWIVKNREYAFTIGNHAFYK